MHDVLPPAMLEFLVSPGTEWDAPIVGERFNVPAIPGPAVYDLRARRAGKRPTGVPARPEMVKLPTSNSQLPIVLSSLFDGGNSGLGVGSWELGVDRSEAAVGSNSWVVSGALTADGRP